MSSMTQSISQSGPLGTASRPRQEDKSSLFAQALDVVNPLQHVPGVSQGYRAITKDKISSTSQFLGHIGFGTAIAGPVGAAVGAGVFIIEKAVPALFKAIGKLFNGGGNDPAKDAARLTKHLEAPAQAPTQAPVTGGGEPIRLSADQFAAILKAFPGATLAQTATETAPEGTQPEQAIQAEPLAQASGADIAAQIRANLAKYEAMRLKLEATTAQ